MINLIHAFYAVCLLFGMAVLVLALPFIFDWVSKVEQASQELDDDE